MNEYKYDLMTFVIMLERSLFVSWLNHSWSPLFKFLVTFLVKFLVKFLVRSVVELLVKSLVKSLA